MSLSLNDQFLYSICGVSNHDQAQSRCVPACKDKSVPPRHGARYVTFHNPPTFASGSGGRYNIRQTRIYIAKQGGGGALVAQTKFRSFKECSPDPDIMYLRRNDTPQGTHKSEQRFAKSGLQFALVRSKSTRSSARKKDEFNT